MVLLALVGCSLTKANFRSVKGDGYEALASLRKGQARYYDITLGNVQRPIDSLPDFSMRFSSGEIIASRDFSLENVRTHADKVIEKNGVVEVRREGAVFTFKRERLISLKLFEAQLPGKVLTVALGDDSATRFTELPVSEDFLVRVFGPIKERSDKNVW
ncbi:MAG: hypothetical protein H0X66_21180 [Verrucomicrobia bacterium]|nr:hypothetical protein [Verrucomicrobiota bacterium]